MIQSFDDSYLTEKKALPLTERRARSASPKKSRKQLPANFFVADGPIAAKYTEDELSNTLSSTSLSNQLKSIQSLLVAKNLHITTAGTNLKYVIPIPFQLKMPPKLSGKNKISSPLNSRSSSPVKSSSSNSGTTNPVMVSPPKPLKLVYNGSEYQEMEGSDDSFTSPSSKYKLAGGQKGKVLFTKRLSSDVLSVINEASESSRLSSVKVMKDLRKAHSPDPQSPGLASPAKITTTDKPLPPVNRVDNGKVAKLTINDSIGSISDNTSFANLSLLPSGTSREMNSFHPTSLPLGNNFERSVHLDVQMQQPVLSVNQKIHGNPNMYSQPRMVSYSSVGTSGSSMSESLWNSLQESVALNNHNENLPLAPSVNLEGFFSTDTETDTASSELSCIENLSRHTEDVSPPAENISHITESISPIPNSKLQQSPTSTLSISSKSSQRRMSDEEDISLNESDSSSKELIETETKAEEYTEFLLKDLELNLEDTKLGNDLEKGPKCDPSGDVSFNSGLGKRFSFPNSLENATNEINLKNVNTKEDDFRMASTKRHSFVSEDGQIEIPELEDYDLFMNTKYNATSLYNTGSESGSISVAAGGSINGLTTGSAVEPLGVPSENARAFVKSQFAAMFPNSDSDTDVEPNIPKSKSNPDITIGSAQRMRNYRRHSRGKSLHSIDFDYSSNLNKSTPQTPSNTSLVDGEMTPGDQSVNRNKTLPRIPNSGEPTATKETTEILDSPIRAKSLKVEAPPNPVRYKVDFVDKKTKAPSFNANPSHNFNYMEINKTLDSLANHQWRGPPTTISSLSNSSYQSSRTAKYSNSTRATDTESIVMDLTDDKYDICTVKKSDSVLSYRSVTEVQQGKPVEVILVDDDDVEDDLASIYSRYRSGWQEENHDVRRTVSLSSSTSSYTSSASDSSYKSFESGASNKLMTKSLRNPTQQGRILLQNAGRPKPTRVNSKATDYQNKLRTEFIPNEIPTNSLRGYKISQRATKFPVVTQGVKNLGRSETTRGN